MLVDALNYIWDLKYYITGCMNSKAARLKSSYFREGRRKKDFWYMKDRIRLFYFVYLKYLCIMPRITFCKIFCDKT